MRKSHSKLRKVLPLVLGLAVGGAGISNADTWLRTDSIALTNYLQTISLTPDSRKDLGTLLENQKAKVMDPRIGIKNILTYIKKVGPYSENEKEFLIGRYQKFLKELEKERPDEFYNSSLRLLNEAVKDRVLDSKSDRLYENDNWKIKPGKYMIKYGNEKWSVPVFVDIKLSGARTSEKEITLPLLKVQEEKKYAPHAQLSTVEIKEKEEAYELPLPQVPEKEECKKGIVTYTKEMPELSLQPPYSICKDERKKLHLPQASEEKAVSKALTPYAEVSDEEAVSKALTPYAEVSDEEAVSKALTPYAEVSDEEAVSKALTPYAEVSKREKIKAKKVPREIKGKENYFSLLAQGTTNSTLDDYSASIGARYNFNKHLGVGASLDLGYGLDKLVESYTAPLSAGRVASGKITDTDKTSIGASLEAQLGFFVLGAGLDYKKWIANTTEQILDSTGSVLKSNSNSVQNRQAFAKVYGGLEVPLTQNWKLGAVAGYNWRDGVYGGLRTVIKLNNRKK